MDKFNPDVKGSRPEKKLSNLLRCVEREIEMRKRVYPTRVLNGKMTQGQADYEIKCMNEIANILVIIERKRLYMPFNVEELKDYTI